MRAETPPRRRNDGTSSAVGAAPSTHSNRTTLRGTARPSSDTDCTRAPARVRRDGRRLDDALRAQRLEPGQLGLDLAGVVVAGPVHAERCPATGRRIVDPVRPVLRDVDQRRGCPRREVVVLERGSCEPVELILRRLVPSHTFSRSRSSGRDPRWSRGRERSRLAPARCYRSGHSCRCGLRRRSWRRRRA